MILSSASHELSCAHGRSCAIVEIKSDHRIEVSTPPEEQKDKPKRFTITEEEFYRKLSDNVAPDAVAFVKRVHEEAPKHQLDVYWMQSGPLLKYSDNDSGKLFSLGGFDREGYWTWEYALSGRCISLGLPDNIWTGYLDTLVQIMPGTKREKGGTKSGDKWEEIVYSPNAEPSVNAIMANEAKWWAAIDKVVSNIKRAMTNPPSKESRQKAKIRCAGEEGLKGTGS